MSNGTVTVAKINMHFYNECKFLLKFVIYHYVQGNRILAVRSRPILRSNQVRKMIHFVDFFK